MVVDAVETIHYGFSVLGSPLEPMKVNDSNAESGLNDLSFNLMDKLCHQKVIDSPHVCFSLDNYYLRLYRSLIAILLFCLVSKRTPVPSTRR